MRCGKMNDVRMSNVYRGCRSCNYCENTIYNVHLCCHPEITTKSQKHYTTDLFPEFNQQYPEYCPVIAEKSNVLDN